MPNELDPIVNQWYAHRDKGEAFRVVAVDPAARLVECQDFDGAIEELDMDAWRDLDIELTEAPEDWTGPFDDVETDDLGYAETEMTAQDWRAPLESVHTAEEPWQDARPPDEHPEDEEGRPTEPYVQEEKELRQRTQ